MLMGFFTGIRNIYQHSHVGSGVSNSIATIIQASFFLNILDGKSITKKGEWIKTNINYGYIYNHMPKLTDRIRLRLLLSRRNRRNQAKTEDIKNQKNKILYPKGHNKTPKALISKRFRGCCKRQTQNVGFLLFSSTILRIV